MPINIKTEVETILGRSLTSKEIAEYRFYWTQIFMNSFDLAKKIQEG